MQQGWFFFLFSQKLILITKILGKHTNAYAFKLQDKVQLVDIESIKTFLLSKPNIKQIVPFWIHCSNSVRIERAVLVSYSQELLRLQPPNNPSFHFYLD